jgi:hypothetical protein
LILFPGRSDFELYGGVELAELVVFAKLFLETVGVVAVMFYFLNEAAGGQLALSV